MAAAIGPIIGGLVGAGGQIGGGVLAGKGTQKPSELVSSNYLPNLDYALQASNFDALNQIGFGDFNDVPSPLQRLFGQIQSASLDAKTRRRALDSLSNIISDPTLLDDPYGKNFSQRDILLANKTGDHFGRVVTRGKGGKGITKAAGGAAGAAAGANYGPYGAAIGGLIGSLGDLSKKNDTAPTGLPVKHIGRVKQALNAAGLTLDDVKTAVQRERDFKDQRERFKAAGLPQLAEQSVINRAKANAAANAQLGAVADFSSTGSTSNPLLQSLIAQDNRGLDRLATRAGLQANFGGINPAGAYHDITNAQLDQNLRVLEHSLGIAGGLQSVLGAGNAVARGNVGQTLNSASIAAQQAQSANALRSQNAQNRSDSFGNAIASGASSLGSGIANYSLLNAYGKDAPSNSGTKPSTFNFSSLFGAAG